MKNIQKIDKNETKLTFKGIEYAFIIMNEQPLIRRIDGLQPNEYELVSVGQYIEKEFLIS